MCVDSCEQECKGCAPKEHIKSEYWIVSDNADVFINLYFGNPYAIGHIVIQPNRRGNPEGDEYHPKDISTLTQDEWKALSKWIPKISKAMKKVLEEIVGREVEKIYLCAFNESPDWHVHFHLIPRYKCETIRGDEMLFYRSKTGLIISPNDKKRIVEEMQKELKQEG